MKKSKMTYELFEVARLILDKEDRLSIVIRHLEAEQRPDALLAVSVPDGHPFLSEGDAVSHVMSRHLDKFFDVVEVEVEAPKGSFLMVAKCSQTGKLLGAEILAVVGCDGGGVGGIGISLGARLEGAHHDLAGEL